MPLLDKRTRGTYRDTIGVWLHCWAKPPSVNPAGHDLRHTDATLLIASGEHPKVIQQRLGHASIRTTLDTYGHLFEGLDQRAAERLDTLFRRAAVTET